MVTPAAVQKVLGGLGKGPQGAGRDFALAQAVREGLPYSVLEHLIDEGIVEEREVEMYFIARRTLYSRRLKATLSREQSDIVVRLARIQAMADDVLGRREQACAWLREPNGALSGQIPLALLDTEEGGRLVEAVLGRIAHGIVE
ncbi:MAG: type II RES/Xre toxin-antitoxin system antitoxin [Acetobacteraceae bacterium]